MKKLKQLSVWHWLRCEIGHIGVFCFIVYLGYWYASGTVVTSVINHVARIGGLK